MPEERGMILKMLEEGKITAEQAVELIAAVAKKPVAEHPRKEHVIDAGQKERNLRRIVRDEERRVRQQVKEESRKARSAVREALREIRSSIPRGLEQSIVQSLRGIGPGLGGGKEFGFTREFSGEFAVESAFVNIQNTNGHIVLSQSPDHKWHLSLSVRVRAENEAAAKAVAERLVTVTSDTKSVIVAAQKLFGQNAAVNIALKMPDLPVKLNAASTNGTINVSDLNGQEFILKTVNGKVIATGIKATQIEAGAINGSIIVSATTPVLKCKGANGRIEAELKTIGDANVELNTVNGAIELILPDDEQIGYTVNAVSTAGSVRVSIPGLEERDEVHRPGRRAVRAQSVRLGEMTFKQSIEAKTVSGRIRIHTKGEEL